MKRVLFFTLNGWPSHVDNEALQPYFVRRHELSVDQGCVTWGNRVIIPEVFREKVLSLLHEGHPGTTRMKMLSRSHVWWPLITYDVENTVKNCSTCQLTQNAPPRVPLLTWGWPTRRWQRVHLDFAYRDQNWFLIVVDAHSKWVEVFLTSSTTTKCTIERLRSVFAAFGLPEEVVTDNGPQFVATEFVEFLSMNGVRHTKSPPYHPASNGSAERCVQTVKRDLLRQVIDEQRTGVPKSMQHRVDQFLFAYRNTPTGTTDKTPAELFLSWKPRTRLSFLHPEMERRMRDRQQQIKTAADMRRGSWRTFEEGDQVLVRGSRPTDPAWLVGRVMKKYYVHRGTTIGSYQAEKIMKQAKPTMVNKEMAQAVWRHVGLVVVQKELSPFNVGLVILIETVQHWGHQNKVHVHQVITNMSTTLSQKIQNSRKALRCLGFEDFSSSVQVLLLYKHSQLQNKTSKNELKMRIRRQQVNAAFVMHHSMFNLDYLVR
ncbi:uncharacterized protein K02A2.6-like [Ixodes scapularis]|uniref:uncharacterized protein K02A2.6-like n=1 Tax=Ixodes scapularis TaxID=6945 RepID=UPI001C38DEE1|nr:uncharacterized protein K02A2.6-like [Ixodes scapularis]